MSFKICVIGCGGHSRFVHGPSYKKYAENYPDTLLAACCDLDPIRAKEYRQLFGFKACYTDIDEMLDIEKPDAVCLVVGEPFIAALSVKVIEKGYPILMEKPPGLTKEETLEIVAAAEKNRVPNKVAFNRWYIPIMVKLKEVMRANLQSDEIHHIRYDFYRTGRTESRFHVTAIHGISAVSFLAESPFDEIHFTYQELPSLGEHVANIYMECKFASGVIAHLHFCPVAGVVIERATVNSLHHTIFAELPIWASYDDPGRLIHIENGQVISDTRGDPFLNTSDMYITNGFYAENESFFNMIRNRAAQEGGVESAPQIVEIADCIRLRKKTYSRFIES